MSHTERLRRSPNAFRQLTGITPAAFDRLLAELTPRYEQAEARRKDRPGRQRKPGAGPKHALDLADRLLMLLIYYRTYATHAFLGFLFGVDDSAVGRNINPLAAAAGRHLPHPRAAGRARPGGDPRAVLRRHRAAHPPARARASGSSTRARRSGTRSRPRWWSSAAPSRPGPGAKPRRLRIAAVSESFPGSVARQEGLRPDAGGGPARREADGGHGLPRDGAGDARPASPAGAS